MEDYRGGGLTEVKGGFLGLLGVFIHVGREPWCSRGRVGPRLQQFSDGQPLVQGRLICVKNQFNPATIKNDNGSVAMRIIFCNAKGTKNSIELKKYNIF